MKILVVEDQPVVGMMLAAAMRALGHDVELVADGTEAWERLGDGEHRVVVSDWKMPGIDGLELCRRIRARDGEYIYYILVSVAGLTPVNREAALAAGVDDFLMKPVNPDELRMRLHVAERILQATAQITQLESFLPICCYCKKIRDDKDYWTQIEEYYAKRDGTRFSHGICPECYQREVEPQWNKLGPIDEPE